MSNAVPTEAGETGLILAILTGPHAPAQLRLANGPNTIGTDPDNDVVLADDALAPFHFTLTVSSDSKDVACLKAVGGPVLLGTALVQDARPVICSSGTMLRAGSTAFELRASMPVAVGRRRASHPAATARHAVALACAATVLSFFALPAAIPRTASTLAIAIAPVPEPVRAAPSPAAHASFEQQLASVGLSGITLSSLSDGSVEARGEIMPQQMDQWREAQHWFDAGSGGQAVLVNRVTATAAPPLAIQAVWPGPHPYVIDGSGEKLFAGAMLRGGWTVDSIAADHVLIRRGSQTLAVRF